uniref:Nitrite reductase n=1 Tax=Lygus hesperus TaxID=30085 RepID=A0A0A9YWA1_LYGHE
MFDMFVRVEVNILQYRLLSTIRSSPAYVTTVAASLQVPLHSLTQTPFSWNSTATWYTLPWEQSLEVMKSRRGVIHNRQCYIPDTQVVPILLGKYQKILQKRVINAKKNFQKILEKYNNIEYSLSSILLHTSTEVQDGGRCRKHGAL